MQLAHRDGLMAVVGFPIVLVLVLLGFDLLVERCTLHFRPLRPQFCSIYDRTFWRHERFWKLSLSSAALLNGTPFKSLLWRALGVRIGRRVFDDGCGITERSLVSIGDDCTLNAATTIQCHSLEDGAFKSAPIEIGARCDLGVGAFVHYGTVLGDGSAVDADAFLMKGSELAPGSRWWGNPATERASR